MRGLGLTVWETVEGSGPGSDFWCPGSKAFRVGFRV